MMMGIIVTGITAIRQSIQRVFHAFKYKPIKKYIPTDEAED